MLTMVKTKDEIMAGLKEILGENASEAAISFVEDVTDTINDYETRTNDATDWKKKYEENDANWAKRYRDRFFSGEQSDPDSDSDDGDENPEDKPLTYENLFTEVK